MLLDRLYSIRDSRWLHDLDVASSFESYFLLMGGEGGKGQRSIGATALKEKLVPGLFQPSVGGPGV